MCFILRVIDLKYPLMYYIFFCEYRTKVTARFMLVGFIVRLKDGKEVGWEVPTNWKVITTYFEIMEN